MQTIRGAAAVHLLQRHLDERSYACLQALQEAYPDDAVELSAYDCRVGVLGWNTLFWEVRGIKADAGGPNALKQIGY
jgi:uncharacterized membrane protein